MNYYNENDPFAAAWLRELIKAKLIGNGEVDERSIEDVEASELRGFQQCHFFAGIGVWSLALRNAGWGDDRPVWTGSCPCQSFSAAGQRKGFNDKRHLWPVWFPLIRECRPESILGEQVASKDALAWLDLVSSDLEGTGYTVGAVDTCAAGFGAPHIRQRIYFMAHPDGGKSSDRLLQRSREYGLGEEDGSVGCAVVNAESEQAGVSGRARESGGAADGMAHTESQRDWSRNAGSGGRFESSNRSYWSNCSWLPCIDGKTRPVEPGTFPLAHGIANRVGTLRGYGNALVAPQAEEFLRACMEVLG